MRFLLNSLTLISFSLLISCGNTELAKLAKNIRKPLKTIAELAPPAVPVVEVRKEDLKKLPTGTERALAWDRHLDSQRYAANTTTLPLPTNYSPPSLPDLRSSTDMIIGGGILPSRTPGQSSTLKGQGDLEEPSIDAEPTSADPQAEAPTE